MTQAAGVIGVIGFVLIASLSYAVASGDLVLRRKVSTPGAQAFPPAVFPHELHRTLYKCYVCHDALFKMKPGSDNITMDAISAGKYCGACHEGKTSFEASSFDNCDRCHRK
ncbi:MAG TPA: cytochrome c3 family protein [Candidatus Binataceae bacterium]|nr:cytochrome c3 family protein [Candidatus Binataceae bacterium]